MKIIELKPDSTFKLLQSHLVAVKNGIGEMLHPVAQIDDMRLVVFQREIDQHVAMTENKIIQIGRSQDFLLRKLYQELPLFAHEINGLTTFATL